jgi:hypothetical protein
VARPGRDAISVRATEDPATILSFQPGEWREFTDGVKDGRFDRS